MLKSKTKIMLVEDDPLMSFMVKDFLQKKGYSVDTCTTAEAAWKQFMKNIYDLCLIDVMLPGELNGRDLAKNIRNKNINIPIILLSSMSLESDKIAGFKSGADNYLTKPCNLRELEMRINVLIRRSSKKEEVKRISYKIGQMVFDYQNLTLKDDVTEHLLTQREADLMLYFCMNSGRLITRNEILIKLWGKDDLLLRKSLDVFVSRVRKYLKAQHIATLETVPGQGFIFKNVTTKGSAAMRPKPQEVSL